MKLMVLVCVHGRRNVTRIFYAGMNRLHRELSQLGVEMSMTVVFSDHEDYVFATQTMHPEVPINYVKARNNPVSEKHNTGFVSAMKHEWDALMIMGSDDLISTAGVNKLCQNIQSLDYCGYESVYFHNSYSKEFREFRYKGNRLVGCGRMLSRKACESLTYGNSYRLWDRHLDRGLDKNSSAILLRKGFKQNVIDFPTCMLDIKSSHNITNYQNIIFLSETVSMDTATWFLGEDELSLMLGLC